jgi:hypothetical protein
MIEIADDLVKLHYDKETFVLYAPEEKEAFLQWLQSNDDASGLTPDEAAPNTVRLAGGAGTDGTLIADIAAS